MTKMTPERKAELSLEKMKRDAKVFDARSLPSHTPMAQGDKMMKRLLATINPMIECGQAEMQNFANRLLIQDAASAFAWLQGAFDSAVRLNVALHLKAVIDELSANQDEYTMKSNLQIVTIIRDSLKRDVLSAARYPERSTSVQSNEIKRSAIAAKAKILEVIEDYFDYYM